MRLALLLFPFLLALGSVSLAAKVEPEGDDFYHYGEDEEDDGGVSPPPHGSSEEEEEEEPITLPPPPPDGIGIAIGSSIDGEVPPIIVGPGATQKCGSPEELSCADGSERRQYWYWDETWFRCLATTSACEAGPVQGFYATIAACHDSCRPMDGPTCPGPGPYGEFNTERASEEDPFPNCFESGRECSAGFTCRMGAFTAACCDETDVKRRQAAYADTCANGAMAYPNTDLTGLACDHLICPDGYECRQDPEEQFFARCCSTQGSLLRPKILPSLDEPGKTEGGGETATAVEAISTAGKFCPDPLKEWRDCGTACPDACGDAPLVCTMQCVAGCFCRAPYVLLQAGNPDSECVTKETCAGVPDAAEVQCGDKEVLEPCGNACEARCSALGAAGPQPCPLACFAPACACAPGLYRNEEGLCVAAEDCPPPPEDSLPLAPIPVPILPVTPVQPVPPVPAPVPTEAISPGRVPVCEQPLVTGPCRAAVPSFYFDATLKDCVAFVYGGCEGNDNRFATLDECENICGGGAESTPVVEVPVPAEVAVPEPEPAPVLVVPPPAPGAPMKLSCTLGPEPGPCRARLPRYYFDVEKYDCFVFFYGGCEGNGNAYESREECLSQCADRRILPSLVNEAETAAEETLGEIEPTAEEREAVAAPITLPIALPSTDEVESEARRLIGDIAPTEEERSLTAPQPANLLGSVEPTPDELAELHKLRAPETGAGVAGVGGVGGLSSGTLVLASVDPVIAKVPDPAVPFEGDCVDEHTNCPVWASVGFCLRNAGYMLLRCQRSCGSCGVTKGDLINARFPDPCADRRTECPAWATTDQCRLNSGYMHIYCRSSCKIC